MLESVTIVRNEQHEIGVKDRTGSAALCRRRLLESVQNRGNDLDLDGTAGPQPEPEPDPDPIPARRRLVSVQFDPGSSAIFLHIAAVASMMPGPSSLSR